MICLLPALLLTAKQAPAQENIPPEITLSLKAGNAIELAKHFNETLEVVILDKEDYYTKVVAERIMKDFFRQYPVKDFEILHQAGKNGARYAIGTLKTEKGNFRVYFLIKVVEQKPLIHQLRIKKQ